MNQGQGVLPLRSLMESAEGWGRTQGRLVYAKLLDWVEHHPDVLVFQVSMKGVTRVDLSFASETIVEAARRYRGAKGFSIIDISDADMIENIDAAAHRKQTALLVRQGHEHRLIGAAPSEGNRGALDFALRRTRVRAAEFAKANRGMSIANASTKYKQLWEQGFLLRQECVAESGGVEFQYLRIS